MLLDLLLSSHQLSRISLRLIHPYPIIALLSFLLLLLTNSKKGKEKNLFYAKETDENEEVGTKVWRRKRL
jgi:hypothetical protein